jgi:hypothetical protein
MTTEGRLKPSILAMVRSDRSILVAFVVSLVAWIAYVLVRETYEPLALYLALLITAVSLLIVIWRYLARRALLRRGVQVPGRIVDIGFDGVKGRVDYAYEYEDEACTGCCPLRRTRHTRALEPGDPVLILVDPHKPGRAELYSLDVDQETFERMTEQEAAASEEEELAPEPEVEADEEAPSGDWLLDSVHYFRNLEFYGQHADLSDEELAERVEMACVDKWGAVPDPGEPRADLKLLHSDQERVWWKNTEAEVREEHRVYVQALNEWTRISRGAFQPSSVSENWATAAGPVDVTYELDGSTTSLWPNYLRDSLDMTVLDRINDDLGETGCRFEVYEPFDETAFVVVLTPGEKAELEKERGWQFVDWDDLLLEGWD